MSVNKYNSTTGNLERLDGYTVDSTPTQNSGNPVSSGGVFTALAGKLDKTGGTVSGDLEVSGDITVNGMATLKNDKLTFANGEALNLFNVENPVGTADANDYTAPGVYMSELRTNNPTNGYFILIVLGNSSYIRQIAFDMFNNYVYTRYLASNSWSAWKEFQFISQ